MNAIVRQTPRSAVAPVLNPTTFDQLARFAEMAAGSDLMPPAYKGKPGNIMIAVQMGSELGLPPMQALQNIAVVNGRPAVWGDAMPALCRRSPLCQDIQESIAGEGEAMVATCVAVRTGASPVTSTFSVLDAKKAGLWGKAGPWQQYPKRMLQMRARGFALRDAFPDLLRGLISGEEAADIPAEPAYAGQTIDLTPKRQPAARPAAADLPMIQTDVARDLVDDFIKKLALTDDCAKVRAMATWAEESSGEEPGTKRGILLRVREARRPDLDTMLTDAIAAARLRCPSPPPPATPDDGWPGPGGAGDEGGEGV